MSGGRSSTTRAVPTWFTAALVTPRIARSERQRRASPPEEIRARLHERVAALEGPPPLR